MGWGKNRLGQWDTTIRFRVLEETTGLDAYLGNAAYGGAKFEVAREDGAKDIIYCQEEACRHGLTNLAENGESSSTMVAGKSAILHISTILNWVRISLSML